MNKFHHAAALVALCVIVVTGCGQSGPVEIHYGMDQCDYCNMNIVDKAFGSQLVTSKKKVFRFDSIECLAAYVQTQAGITVGQSSMWVTDFLKPGVFVRVDSSAVIVCENQNSPMGIGLVGFGSITMAENFIKEKGGRILNWSETSRLVSKRWKL